MDLTLGTIVRDRISGIDGVLIAKTQWHDRSDECAILRDGRDAEGKPFDVLWFPASRIEKA